MWPRPSHPGVGHGLILFDTICFFTELALYDVLGDLSTSQSVCGVSYAVWIFFGRPRFFFTLPKSVDCTVMSSFDDGHSWQILGPRCTPFSFSATHDEWSPLSQVTQVSSSTWQRKYKVHSWVNNNSVLLHGRMSLPIIFMPLTCIWPFAAVLPRSYRGFDLRFHLAKPRLNATKTAV